MENIPFFASIRPIFAQFAYLRKSYWINKLTFIKVIVTLLKALPKSVSCYENAFYFKGFRLNNDTWFGLPDF